MKGRKKMQLQRLLSYTRKAVDEYSMIQEGDHIAVGISGGKDSLTLLYALHGLKRFYPRKFDLSAVTVDLGFADFNIRPMMFIDEMEVIGFRNKYSLPVVKGKCPVDGHTKRQYAKELLRELNKEHPGTKERMFHAILTGDIKGWPQRTISRR